MKNRAPTTPVVTASRPQTPRAEIGFALAAGALLGLSLLKFPNPGLLEQHVEAPRGFWEFVIQPWPILWGYGLLAVVVLLGIAHWAGQTEKRLRMGWLASLPMAWFAWQLIASPGSVAPLATRVTLLHFATLIVGYLLAYHALARVTRMDWFWAPFLGGFLLMLWYGFGQHYGGLEATREYVFSQPGWENLPADQIKRLKSERIFSTLFYPNALAGAILLLLPPLGTWLWHRTNRWPSLVRMVATGLVGYVAVGCLLWTGSKAGWLIAVAMAGVVLWQMALPARWKPWVLGLVVVLGLAGFGIRFAPYFSRGATSVGARMEYWRAAATTAGRHPFLGTGPGTFAFNYRNLKRPEAEMAQLTHNDYLQQACDSGLPGALCLTVFVVGSLVRLRSSLSADPLRFSVWLGLLGWGLQSAVEFGLYLPAISWPAFWLLGWLWGGHRQSRNLAAAPTSN